MLVATKPETAKLLQYNAFGLISISPKSITASVTVVLGTRSITRSVVRNFEVPLPGIDQDEGAAIVFGATIERGQKTHITFHEVGTLRSGVAANEISSVSHVLGEAIDLVREAAKI